MTFDALAKHLCIGVDSNVLIYLLEDSGPLAETSAALIDGFAAGEREGVLASLALAEICAGPARVGETALLERYADELTSLENVRVVSMDAEIAVDAAVLRGPGPLLLSDAIHLASARRAGATAFVTNDRRIKSTSNLEVFYLDELA